MHRKLIALAIAGIASGAAFAQSNVTVYGIVDVGYGYYTDGNDKDANAIHKIDGNQWKTTRFGFKGSEDLGDGLSANFQLEASLLPDTATLGGRNSWVSLKSGKLGEVKAGSFGSFHDDLLGATSVMFGNATVAAPTRVYVLTTGSAESGDMRNAVAYYSPNFSGFQLKVGASTHGDTKTDDAVPSGLTAATGNERVYALAAHYANGPLVAGATYEMNKYQDYEGAPSIDSGNEWHLAGSYDFGVARIAGAYGKTSYAQNPGVTKEDRKQWQLGVSAPISSNGTLALSYARAKIGYNDGNDDDKVSFWGVGYLHTLSKRTSLYAAYGDISQSDDNITKSRIDGSTTTSDAGYQSAFNVGIRHNF